MAEKKKPAAKAAPKKKKAASEEVQVIQGGEHIETAAPVVKHAAPAVVHRPKKAAVPKGEKFGGTGRRKEAIARVWLKPGTGNISVNAKPMSQYFCGRRILENKIVKPLEVTNTRGNYDVFAEAYGGGIPGQAGAVSLGIARALLEVSPDFKVKLKREGLLTRDPRMKERKKYGLKLARRAFQYTKR